MLAGLYDLPQRIAQKKGKRLVVVFDEFQEIMNLNGDRIEREPRTKIQHHDSVSYVFMGSRKHLLDGIFADKNRPLYRIGKPFSLDKIPFLDFKEFIVSRFRDSGVKAPKDVAEEILRRTDSHTYYTQQLCHELWNLCRDKMVVELADIDSAVKEVIANQSYAYTTIWESLPGLQRSLLMAIALEGGGRIYSEDFREKHHLGGPSSMQKAVKYLEEKGIVER